MDSKETSSCIRTKYLRCSAVLVVMTILILTLFDLKPRLSNEKFTQSSKDIIPRSSDSYRQTKELYKGTRSRNSSRQTHELQRLGDLVQRRLFYLQNPRNCITTKKILCKYAGAGYGSQMHDWIFCLIVAYATQRTLIIESRGWRYAERGLETIFLPLSTNCTSTNNQTAIRKRDLSHVKNIPVVQLPRHFELIKRPKYFPFAIPEDIADELLRVHKNPAAWWIGQFLVYITRQNQILEHFVQDSIATLGFRHPIVGIHVRRTDKRKEARYHDLSEYMGHVKIWFDNYEKKHHVVQRRVFLASDDPGVLMSARKRYPKYTFLSNVNASAMAKKRGTRYSVSSLQGIVLDIQMLSTCDFVVCTISSSVGRLVYLMMHVRYWDATDRIRSLDLEYTFTRVAVKKRFFERNRNKSYPNRLHEVRDNSKHPLRGMVSFDNRQSRVKMPTYPEVPRRQ